MSMRVDMRVHKEIRAQVHAGLSALRVQGKQVWTEKIPTMEIILRLMNGVDLSRTTGTTGDETKLIVKKELGTLLFSIIIWADAIGFDVLECLDLAVEARESGDAG